MKKLLELWGKLEPEKCEKSSKNIFTVQTGEEAKNIYDPDGLSGLDLAWIQWAAQEAIVQQGWRYNLECYKVTGIFEGIVFFSSGHTRRPGNNPAEALLGAYLAVLEASR